MKQILVILIAFILSLPALQAQGDNFKDTVWTNLTDQSDGFFQVKFSKNDSMFYAMGYKNIFFYETTTGKEIKRLPGIEEAFFIENDSKFIMLNETGTCFHIYDLKTFQIIDSLESDGTVTEKYSYMDLTKDEHYFISSISKGFRIWDLRTRKILRTKRFQDELNLLSVGVGNIRISCDQSKIIGQFGKSYYNPNNPNNPIRVGSFTIYDFNSLDSIDNLGNNRYFKLSKTCKYIAYNTGNKDSGVTVYDFNTRKLLWTLPVNGPSLTGIEFTPDDKYVVTANGPGDDNLSYWDLITGKNIYLFENTSFSSIDISHDGTYIIGSSGRTLLKIKPSLKTDIPENPDTTIIIYPNPTSGTVNISFEQEVTEQTNIELFDYKGNLIRELFSGFLEAGKQNLLFPVNDLSNGNYIITLNNSHLSLYFKIIVNK